MEVNAPILPPKPSHHDASRIGTPLNSPASPARLEGARTRNPSPSSAQGVVSGDTSFQDTRVIHDPGDAWIPPTIEDLG